MKLLLKSLHVKEYLDVSLAWSSLYSQTYILCKCCRFAKSPVEISSNRLNLRSLEPESVCDSCDAAKGSLHLQNIPQRSEYICWQTLQAKVEGTPANMAWHGMAWTAAEEHFSYRESSLCSPLNTPSLSSLFTPSLSLLLTILARTCNSHDACNSHHAKCSIAAELTVSPGC